MVNVAMVLSSKQLFRRHYVQFGKYQLRTFDIPDIIGSNAIGIAGNGKLN